MVDLPSGSRVDVRFPSWHHNVLTLPMPGPTGAPGGSDAAFGGWLDDDLSETAAAARRRIAETDADPDSVLRQQQDKRLGLGASAALQTVMQKLAAGVDTNVVILSDSTADSTTEWGYLFGQQLGTAWLQRRVLWYPADTTDEIGYGAAVTIQAPVGYVGTLHIWNYALAGRNSYGWQSAVHFDAAVVAPNPDAVLISSGHNDGTFTPDSGSLGTPRQAFRLRYLAVTEHIRQAVPAAGIVLISQNPWQDNGGDMAAKRDEFRLLSQARGYGFIDLYETFANHPSRSTFYLDNVHPNAAGEKVYADVIRSAFQLLPRTEPRTMPPSVFDGSAVNLADDLTLPTGASLPAGWTTDNASVVRDTVRFETSRGYAIRLVPVAAASASRIYRQVFDSEQVKAYRGRWVVLAARVWRNSGGVGNRWVGRMGVSDGMRASYTQGDDVTSGSFVWRFVPHYVDPAATNLILSLYCDSAGGATDPLVTFDRVMLIPGEWPAGHAGRRIPGAWTAYTPTLTGFAGTVNFARYRIIGNSIRVMGQVTLSAVPTATMEVSLPLPVIAAARTGRVPVGTAIAWDIGTGAKQGNSVVTSGGDRISFLGENGTWNATIPHAWAANDVVAFQLEYEVA